MATEVWTSPIAQDTTADFVAMGTEFHAKLAAVGLIQTADTGQVDWATATKPAADTSVYEIWRFNDALQGTAPIFIKFYFGSNNSGPPNKTTLSLQVGTGTNGAGVLTGIFTPITPFVRDYGYFAMAPGSYPSYMCYKDGSFSLYYKVGGTNQGGPDVAWGSVAINRTCDTAGAWSALGASIYSAYNTSVGNATVTAPWVQAMRFAAPAEVFAGSHAGFCNPPHGRTALINGQNPLHLHWMPVPESVPILGLCSHVLNQYTQGTFTANIIGVSQRTYFTLGKTGGLGNGADNNGTQFVIATLWE